MRDLVRRAATGLGQSAQRLLSLPDAPLGVAAALGLWSTIEAVIRLSAVPVGDDGPSVTTARVLTAITLGWGSTLPLTYARSQVRLVATAITVSTALTLVTGDAVTLPAMVGQTVAVFVAARSGQRPLAWSLVALVGAYPLAGLVLRFGHDASSLLLGLAVAAAVAGDARRLRAEVRHQAVTLRAAEAALFRHVARGERARIARELHDVVAHHLSMIAVQADLARLATEGMPSDGVRQLEAIGDTARDALREMHRLLGVLRDPETASVDRAPQPGLANINDLIDRARDVGGASVRLIVSGPVSDLDPGVDLTAYRIVQEALSNARRHAPGASVDVVLRYNSDQLRLQIRDSGAGAGRTAPAAGRGAPAPAADGDRLTAGNGLLGMRERAAMVGGTMRAVEAPVAGFVIEAVLPIRSAPAVALQEEVAGSVGR